MWLVGSADVSPPHSATIFVVFTSYLLHMFHHLHSKIIVYYRYGMALDEGRRLAMKKYYSLISGFMFTTFIMYAQYSIAFYYGVKLIDEGYCTPGSVFSVSILCILLTQCIKYSASLVITKNVKFCFIIFHDHRKLKKIICNMPSVIIVICIA